MPYDDELDEPFPRIARPQNSPLPPVSLRGVGAIPIPGMPENHTAKVPSGDPATAGQLPGALGGSTAPAPKIPSAMGQRQAADEAELDRLRTTGSGVSQIGKAHPVAGGLLRGLNVVGGLVAPGLMSRIPGTEEHHQQLLNREQGNVTADIAGEQKEAQTDEARARAEQEQAKADELRHPQPKPKEESWKVVPGVVGPGGKVLQEEANSGQLRWAEGIEGVGPLKEPTAHTPTFEEQTFEEWHQTHPQGTRMEFDKERANAVRKPEGEVGSWQMAEGEHGEPVLFNSKTGETKAAPAGLRAKGTLAANKKDYEKNIAPVDAAMSFADTYLKSGKFTGSDDDTLMLQYFELAKPESGFRLNTAEIKRQNQARAWRDSIEASLRHAATGTWFSDDQRRQIVESMHHIGDAKKAARQGGPGGGQPKTNEQEPARPANVPKEYVFQENGPKGRGWYKPNVQ